MGLSQTLKPATSMLHFNTNTVGIFFISLIVLAVIGGLVYFFNLKKKSKKQWTHKLKISKELTDGSLSKAVIYDMARFPKIKGAEIFKLKKPFLGSHLFPELESYSGINEFEIILSKENEVYYKFGEKFDKIDGFLRISGKHAQIGLALKNMKDNMHKEYLEEKKISTADLIKAGLTVLLIIAAIIGLKFITQASVQRSQIEAASVEKWSNSTQLLVTAITEMKTDNLFTRENNVLAQKSLCEQNSSYPFCRT